MALPNKNYTSIEFSSIVSNADSVIVKSDTLLKIDYPSIQENYDY